MSMSVTISRYRTVPVVQVMGRVDDAERPGTKTLSDTIRKVCRSSKGTVVIDISAIQFLDSHGLGVLVFHNSVMERAGRRLLFYNTNRNQTSYMNRLFDCTNLFRIFTVIYDLEMSEKEGPA
ncbi:MAG: STAS domain-containing protein [Chitinispirillaceae bacterium]|nr:STAS domain-containing protein [Chitinispirillaceae bacterium]